MQNIKKEKDLTPNKSKGRPTVNDDNRLNQYSIRLTKAQISKVKTHGFKKVRGLIDSLT